MFRIALLALIWPIAAHAQPKTDAEIDAARADIARFCAADIQAFVKARKAEENPDTKKTPEEQVVEQFEYMFSRWAPPPDLNLQAYISDHADNVKRFTRGTPDPWMKRIMAEDRLRICMEGRAIRYYDDQQAYIVVQNRTKSPARFMSDDTNWGDIAPGETKIYDFSYPFSAAFRINVEGADAYGPTTVSMKPRETYVLSFGDAGDALTLAPLPPQD